jgi:hypothetical protein
VHIRNVGLRHAAGLGALCLAAASAAGCSSTPSLSQEDAAAQPALSSSTESPDQPAGSAPDDVALSEDERHWLVVIRDFEQVTALALELLARASSTEERWQLLLAGDDDARVEFAASFSVLNDCTILLLQAGPPSERFLAAQLGFEHACERFEAAARLFVTGIGAPFTQMKELDQTLLRAALDEAKAGKPMFDEAVDRVLGVGLAA